MEADLPQREAMEQTGAEKLILLAEDNEDIQAIYSTILRRSGYRVEVATTGDEALEAARALHPDAIILDISLPGIDGWTVAARLKEDPATRDLLILAVTAHALPDVSRKAQELGCAGFLAKPVRPRRVLEEIQSLTRGLPDRQITNGP